MNLLLFILLFAFNVSLISSDDSVLTTRAPFDGSRFNNIEPFEDKGLLSVLKWKLFSKRVPWDFVDDQVFFQPSSLRSDSLVMSVIGHATVLIQVDGVNILTDPHYSEFASPLPLIGPRRVIAPAILFEDLPPIDLVLLSHNHYDHFDLETIRLLKDLHDPVFLTGLGNADLLSSVGVVNMYELDWWSEYVFDGLSIHFTPVQHWSARGIFDKRKSLWGGFYIEATQKIFFAGDTGYGNVFKMIYEKYGKMDVGLLPIGSYEPRWFMKDSHVTPEEAVMIFHDLHLDSALGIHFATFDGLADESRFQPVYDLYIALEKYGLSKSSFLAPEFGVEYNY